ncbi:hypothetical protein DC904_03565 [Vibrio parahaemolyticus]|uniref:hypothetical protein n=1 Tax=Vibrio antiquarius (strain Ex25) TaxID=150340 RepID=UPI0009409143|nr:hypothetical protein [Vibrio antiquarius]EGR3000164.1 hypothetical protein [Vibrio parahaemolyticus]EGR3219786.1 hypothetical protein [Vibrio parahaemolyticus]EJE4192357.1 hypothetical protein [Vibrio parahaemolyticus]OKQ14077.1 hypothetical protein H058_07325 [Vibrio antiquarius]
MSDFIKYLPVGNGDSILIKSGTKTVLTDIKYCAPCDDAYDISKDIKDACSNNHLNYFISTHQDKDHVLGFTELFHCGKPESWKKDEGKILVDEIVCSKRALNEESTDASKDVLKEIKRRNKLTGSERRKDGNRLLIVAEGDSIEVGTRLKGKVLSPNCDEVEGESRNNSSVVISWAYQTSSDSTKTKILLGGDAECEVWERLDDDYGSDDLGWNLCTAPHHCSMTPFASKEDVQDKEADYIDNEKAISALSHRLGSAFVVSSSKEIKRNDDNPPHYKAKNKWLNILKKSATDETAKDRFYCTSTHNEGKAAPVCFILNDKGIRLEKKNSNSKTKSAALSTTTKYG